MRTLALATVSGKGGACIVPVVHPVRAPGMLCQHFDQPCAVRGAFFATLSRF